MNSDRKDMLSDEALSNLLAQTSNADSDNAEVVALKSAIGSYRDESLVWAERRSATQPSLAARAKADRWAAVPQWSLAAVAIMAVTAGAVHFAGYGSEGAAPTTDVTVMTSATTVSKPEDIAADNMLLGSIDQALQYNSVSPAADYQPKPVHAGRPLHTGVTD